MAITAGQQQSLRESYTLGVTDREAAAAAGVSQSTAWRNYNRFRDEGQVRGPKRRDRVLPTGHGWPSVYKGPVAIGLAIGEPPEQSGPGWIG